MAKTTSQTCRVQRWRFFVNTSWVSFTSGFLIYILTLILGYSYGWAALVLVVRAGLWSRMDMTKLSIIVTPAAVEGPGLLLQADRQLFDLDTINRRRTGIRGGRFFIEDLAGNVISGRLFWYAPKQRQAICDFLRDINPRMHLTLADLVS